MQSSRKSDGIVCVYGNALRIEGREDGEEFGPDGAGVIDPGERVGLASEGGGVGVEEDNSASVWREFGRFLH